MKIKNREALRAIKYTLFMISAGAIQFIVSTVLKLILDATVVQSKIFFIKEFILSTFIADTVGLLLSIIWNFTFNRKFTFKAANNVPVAMALALLFYVPFYPFQIWYVDMVEVQLNIGMWGYLIGLITCMILNGVLEFLWQRFVIYRKSIDTSATKSADMDNNAVNAPTEENVAEQAVAATAGEPVDETTQQIVASEVATVANEETKESQK